MRSIRSLFTVLAASAALVAAGSSPATAVGTRSLYSPSTLVLTIANGDQPEPVQRAVMLRCMPVGGDHPAPQEACDALAQADANLAGFTSNGQFCTREYRPVTVTLRGVWRGKFVDSTATYGNTCGLVSVTGPVFAF